MKTLWFTGLPCSGKTTLADALKNEVNLPVVRLDGDHVREGICTGLGWTEEGRYENVRRCSEIAKLLNEQNFYVFASFVSPLNTHHKLIRSIISNVNIIHVNTSAEVCEKRDVRGLWDRAKRGLIKGFTGYDSCYEIPPNAEYTIDTSTKSLDDCVKELIPLLIK